MAHPHTKILEKLYTDFANKDIKAVLAACAPNITFQVEGKSKLAGKYTKETFGPMFADKLFEMSGNTFKLEVHDILASDRHAVVLASSFLTRNQEQVQLRTAHVWRFENGLPVAWYEYPRDLYRFDSIWS